MNELHMNFDEGMFSIAGDFVVIQSQDGESQTISFSMETYVRIYEGHKETVWSDSMERYSLDMLTRQHHQTVQ